MPEIIESLPIADGDSDDIARSLRRYVSLMLGSPPWKVRLQRMRVSDDDRPVAVIDAGVLTTPHSRAGTITQGDVQKMQPFTVVCYPELDTTASRSAQAAGEVLRLLDAGFQRGLVSDDDPPVNIGAPWRVPVYDFVGVAIDGPNRAGPTDPYMHANVDESFNVRSIQDPLDELRFTVVANLRLTWWAGGRVAPGAPLAVSLTGAWKPVPPS